MKKTLSALVIALMPLVASGDNLFSYSPNIPNKGCKKKLEQKYNNWTPEQQEYFNKRLSAKFNIDLDKDGKLDTIIMTSNPAIKNCEDLKDKTLDYDDKSNEFRFDYGTGKSQIFNWTGPLIEKFTLRPNDQTITALGKYPDGSDYTRTFNYKPR